MWWPDNTSTSKKGLARETFPSPMPVTDVLCGLSHHIVSTMNSQRHLTFCLVLAVESHATCHSNVCFLTTLAIAFKKILTNHTKIKNNTPNCYSGDVRWVDEAHGGCSNKWFSYRVLGQLSPKTMRKIS